MKESVQNLDKGEFIMSDNKQTIEIVKNDKENIINTYNRFNVVIKEGHNATLVDFNGKEYVNVVELHLSVWYNNSSSVFFIV